MGASLLVPPFVTPFCKVTFTGRQSIFTTSFTSRIWYNQELAKTHASMHSNVASDESAKVYVPIDGWYELKSVIFFNYEQSSAGYRYTRFSKNSLDNVTPQKSIVGVPAVQGNGTSVYNEFEAPAVAGDYFLTQAFQTSGVTIQIIGHDQFTDVSTWFSVEWKRPL